MPDFLTDPFNRAIALPLLGSLALTIVIRVLGRIEYGPRFAAAAVPVTFIWASGLILGIPDFPPEPGSGGIAYLVVFAWLFGLALDALRSDAETGAWSELGLMAICGFGAVWWLSGGPLHEFTFGLSTLWPAIALIAWLTVTVRVRWVARDPRTPAIMITAMALGVAVVGWISVLPEARDLAAGLMSATGGFLLLLLFGVRLQFASSLLLPSMIALLAVAYQLIEAPDLSGLTLVILALIPFADTVSRRIEIGPEFLRPTIRVVGLVGLAFLPIIIAGLATLVELRFNN